MSLFGKGNWTRFAVAPEDWDAFMALINNPRALFSSSALAARTQILASAEIDSAAGINPPCWPCGDAPMPRSQQAMDQEIHPWIAKNLQDETCLEPWTLPESVEDNTDICLIGDRYWGDSLQRFQIFSEEVKVIGFWLVLLQRQGLDDLNALKEHASAISNSRPFKTLPTSAKTDISKSLESDGLVDYIARTQCPVILDFEVGSIWLGTSTKKLIDAFKFWMGRHAQIMIQPMELSMGSNPGWPAMALGAFVEHDIYALERAEALELAIKERATVEEDEAGDEVEIPWQERQGQTSEEKEKEENKFVLDNIAIYSPDNVQFATVGLDASLSLGVAGTHSVTARQAVDALAVLKSVPDSALVAARVEFKNNVGEGIATVEVEVSAALNSATYKGLDLGYNAVAIETLADGMVGDEFLEAKGQIPLVNRYWYRYYHMLRHSERMIICLCAASLDLDHTLIYPSARGTQEVEQATPAETGVIQGAVTKFVTNLKAQLLPGESVTLSHGSKAATLTPGAVESSIDI